MRLGFAVLAAGVLAFAVGSAGPSVASGHVDGTTAVRAGSYDNASIADVALRYVNQPGWHACADAGRSGLNGSGPAVQPVFDSSGKLVREGDGQCRAFVNCIVWMASGHTQWVGGGTNYFSSLLSPNGGPAGVEIKNIAQLKKGDIVQQGATASAANLHTYIIVAPASRKSDTAATKTFTVVDSNHDYKETVLSYARAITIGPSERAFRMGTGKTTSLPHSQSAPKCDGTGCSEQVAFGGTGAELTLQQEPFGAMWQAADVRLSVTRNGRTIFNAKVTPAEGQMSIALSLARLDSDRFPEIEIDTWSGGNHCCWGSVIYDGRDFKRIVRDWSIGGGGLKDVNRDGIGELLTSDGRFSVFLAALAGSGYPIRIYSYGDHRLVLTTRRFTKAVGADAADWLKAAHTYSSDRNARLYLVNWLADQYTLHNGERSWSEFRGALARTAACHGQYLDCGGRFQQKVRVFLRLHGYND